MLSTTATATASTAPIDITLDNGFIVVATYLGIVYIGNSKINTLYTPIFQKRVETLGYTIKRFRCDNGKGEYDNKLFRVLLTGSGTSFEPCPPYAHHKNGVAERIIGTITEKARAMLIDSQAPVHFWGQAVLTAVYLHRLSPNEGLTKSNGRDGYQAPYVTPYKMLQVYRNPATDKVSNIISYKAPIHHL